MTSQKTTLRQMAPALCAVLALGAASARAQPAAPPGAGMPAVPTTRILAVGYVTPKFTPDALRTVMPDEVRETVRLYLQGKIGDWYTRKDRPGVVFVLNMSDPAAAKQMLDALPLGKSGLMDFDLIPLGPLAPLGLLLNAPAG